MAKIKIVGMPPGQAPDWVRQAWIGIEIPIVENPEPGILCGVKGGPPDVRSMGGHTVTLADALAALREKDSKAAEWWENFPWNTPGRKLVFARDVCELVP